MSPHPGSPRGGDGKVECGAWSVKREPPPCLPEGRSVKSEALSVEREEWRVKRNSVGVRFNIWLASLHASHSTLHV